MIGKLLTLRSWIPSSYLPQSQLSTWYGFLLICMPILFVNSLLRETWCFCFHDFKVSMVLNSDSQLIGVSYGFLRKKRQTTISFYSFYERLSRWKCLTCACYDIASFCNALCSVSLYLFLCFLLSTFIWSHYTLLYERQLVLGQLFALKGSKIIIHVWCIMISIIYACVLV